ncbi:hypothetical protein ALC56_02348, partial [Trachymyrmex septentrionalis]
IPEVPDSILVGTKMFMLVSPLGKDGQPSESILAHRNTSRKIHHSKLNLLIKTVGPIYLWQLNNQRSHHKHMREV